MVVAVAVILGSGLADRPSKAVAGGMVLLFISVAFMVIASITTVPTRSIGITTQFGRPYGHPLSNGAHMVRPWASVEKCDGTVQTLALTDARDRGTDDQDATHDDGPPMAVRIGNQTVAGVAVSMQWNIANNESTVELFKKFKGCGNIEDNLIKRQLQHELNLAYASFDPLGTLQGKDSSGPTSDQRAQQARDQLQKALGDAIHLGTLTVPIVHFDHDTEGRLQRLQQSIADTRVAEQDKQTAEIRRQINELAAKNPSTPCDLLAQLAAKGQLNQLPTNAVQCGGTGSAPVIVQK